MRVQVKKKLGKLTDTDKWYVRKAIIARIEYLKGQIAEYDAIPNELLISNLVHLAIRHIREELAHQELLLVRFTL